MKPILIGALLLFAALWKLAGDFTYYSNTTVLYNEAVFEVYMNVPNWQMDDYFELEKGTYDSSKHIVLCRLPVTCDGFKNQYAIVNRDGKKIICGQDYDEKKHVKYKVYELNDRNMSLLLVKKNGIPLVLFDAAADRELVLATKDIGKPYEKGRINRIYVTADEAYDCCK